jgi:hypothetical protein
LHGVHDRELVRRGVVSYRIGETVCRHPNEPMGIRCKVRCFRVRRYTIEDIGNGFSLVWSQSCNIHQCFDTLMMCRAD